MAQAEPAAPAGAAPGPQNVPRMEPPSPEVPPGGLQEEQRVLVSAHSWRPCPKTRRRLRGETLTPCFGHLGAVLFGGGGAVAPLWTPPLAPQGAWSW